MSEYWKHQDLEGNGLQTINQQYSRLKRDTKTAYFLCVLFPLGIHQFYLKSFSRGMLFVTISANAAISLMYFPILCAALLLIEIVLLIIDIKNTDSTVVNFNKNLKMTLSLQTNTPPPKDFMGRYSDDAPIDDYLKIKTNEITAFETQKNHVGKSRIYSFSEQEALLKEMSKKK